MKTIITTALMFFAGNVYAASCHNQIPAQQLKNLKADPQTYDGTVSCNDSPNEPCLCWDGKDIRGWKVGQRAVTVSNTADCTDASDCTANPMSCPNKETPTHDDKANWPGLDFVSEGRSASGWFKWCERDVLVVDSAGQATADSDDAALASDKSTRANAKTQRVTDAATCVAAVNGVPALTPTEIKDCIKVLVKHVFESSIATGDL